MKPFLRRCRAGLRQLIQICFIRPLSRLLTRRRRRKTHQLAHALGLAGEDDLVRIVTLKHTWLISLRSGNAWSKHRSWNPLGWLPHKYLGRRRDVLAKHDKIYDYFTSPAHVAWSKQEATLLLAAMIDRLQIPLTGRSVLDISGGNGHVADALRQRGARVTLTEYNDAAIEYARANLGVESVKYDFQTDLLSQLFRTPFDIVLLRAAVMFCRNLDRLAGDLRQITQAGSIVIIHKSVLPTLGVFLRTQCDEYNYQTLYQPAHLVEVFTRHGFKQRFTEVEVDPSPYVLDHDLDPALRYVGSFYECAAVRALPAESPFAFRWRDRRWANLIFDTV